MTLLDAPKFDAERDQRNTLMMRIAAAALFVLLVVWWLVAGRPVDWPWNWNHYLFGRAKVNKFLTTVEANDLAKAYGIWMNDANWQQHQQQYATYPFTPCSCRKSISRGKSSTVKLVARMRALKAGSPK